MLSCRESLKTSSIVQNYKNISMTQKPLWMQVL